MVEFIFPNPPDDSSYISLLFHINKLTDVGVGGMVGIGLLFLIFFCLWLIMKAFSFEKGLAVSSFITSILAMISTAIVYNGEHLVNPMFIPVFVGIFVLSFYSLYKESVKTDY